MTIIVILILQFCAVDTNLLFYRTTRIITKGRHNKDEGLSLSSHHHGHCHQISSMPLSMSLTTPINMSLSLLLSIKFDIHAQ